MVALLWLWVFLVASAIAYGRIITPESIGVRYFAFCLSVFSPMALRCCDYSRDLNAGLPGGKWVLH